MVDIEEVMDEMGNPLIHIKDEEKKLATYSIRKSRDGYAMYDIVISAGRLPDSLSGKFLKSMDAQRKVLSYLNVQPVSNTIRRKEMSDRMKKSKEERESNAAESVTKTQRSSK